MTTDPSHRPDPVFDAPWHAQIFALTVSQNENGVFTWSDWAARFGEMLARHGRSKSLNGGEDYFAAWLETLEKMLTERGIAAAEDLAALKAAWSDAYLTTPHGKPVRLKP